MMKLQTGSANSRGVSNSSHNANKSFGSQTGSINFKPQNQASGQENRRPLLQRMFGPSGK
jgi:hypothetical protein